MLKYGFLTCWDEATYFPAALLCLFTHMQSVFCGVELFASGIYAMNSTSILDKHIV